MFSEILLIKPVLAPGDAKKMEKSLSDRFGKVASRFGGGLKAVIKGSILGISIGLLQKLLNPIEALEEKIKSLLGDSKDLRDLADDFNSTPGEVKRLQDVAGSLGIEPDKLRETISKFSQAVDTAREEIKDPFKERSAATQTLKNFTDEQNVLENFLAFLRSLKAASPNARSTAETNVFGGVQHGGVGKLIDADFDKQAAKINEPSAQKLNQSLNKLANLSDLQKVLEIQRVNDDIFKSAPKINAKTIQGIEEGKRVADERSRKQLESFEDLKKASIEIENFKNLFIEFNTKILQGVGQIRELIDEVKSIKILPFFRYFLKGQ